jgi:hypothetical protein
MFNGRGYMCCKISRSWHLVDGKRYLNLGYTLIAKNTLSGATLIKNSLQSGIERIGSQIRQILGFAHVWTLFHNV